MSEPAASPAGLAPALPWSGPAPSQPVLLKGLVSHWPVVQAARQSPVALAAYVKRFCQPEVVTLWRAPASAHGRFFYNERFDGFNFAAEHARLDEVLSQLVAGAGQPQADALYVGSTTVERVCPGFQGENDVSGLPQEALMSLWMGNRTRIAAHQDVPDNLACVAAGRRRFTLFAPEQLPNLYIGPLDFTPAGQPISLVDMTEPDLARYPRFAQAQQAAQVFELEAGDALFIPSLWWHQVEALDSVNLLLNYWWRSSPAFMDPPMAALLLALSSIRDLPPAQRQAWAAQFHHYVFADPPTRHAHIPAHALGLLGPLSPERVRPLRARLLQLLNR
ncbi:cupin-like domain-containing protein [Ideonella paludis]|uniref:Cupin-like domain-containing protein n=1 Tax=Ideonella paludis TaxID=1233411 RepID=A0ABS5DXW8_9BURK|nr:cupin-like domain-containing protein [Ideonella paludis]MBQ0935998.1 cupin-like domain-containing protein [Ideonella paludis]